MTMNSLFTRSVARFAVAALLCVAQGACGQPQRDKPANAKPNASDAKALALEAYKRSAVDKVQKFDCELTEETDAEWAFVCSDLGPTPRPGADNMVLVKKADGSVEVIPGR